MNAKEFVDRCRDFAAEHGMRLERGMNYTDPEDQQALVELTRNGDYFISIGMDLREEKPYEVFEAYVGWTEDQDTDTELWEYGHYKKLGNALSNALTNSQDGRKPIRVWD